MPLTTNVHAYDDVKAVLDAALAAGGGRYTLPTEGKAIYWRARAYYFRKLLYNLEIDRYENVPGFAPSTPYDNMKLKVEGRDVLIEFIKPDGTLKDLQGNPISIKYTKVKDEDEEALFAEAERLAKEFGE